MRKSKVTMLALLVVFLGFGAWASNSCEASDLYLNGYPGLSGIGVTSPTYNGSAGEFQIAIDNGQTNNAIGYCVDFSKEVTVPGGPYSGYNLTSASGQSNQGLQLGAWLIEQYAPGLNKTSWYSNVSGATTDIARAAVQFAVWEVTQETQTNPHFNVLDGSFKVTTDPSSGVATSLANNILTTMYNDLYNQAGHANQYYVDPATISGVNFASSSQYQNFLVAGTGAPVPIPPSVFLFGSGLAGLGIFRRTRRVS